MTVTSLLSGILRPSTRVIRDTRARRAARPARRATVSERLEARTLLTAAFCNIMYAMETQTAGVEINGISVALMDSGFGLDQNNTSEVTLAIKSGPQGAQLDGVLTVAAVDGIATFNGLKLTVAGEYTFEATSPDTTPATTNAFTVKAASPAALKFTTQPADHAAGTLGTISVTVQDEFGNTVTDSNTWVTLSDGSSPSGGVTLDGTTMVGAENGVATFTNVQLTKAGTYSLYASTQMISSGALSDSFTVTAGPAAGLKFTTQPGDHAAGTLGTIVVTVQDEFGNTITDSNALITLTDGGQYYGNYNGSPNSDTPINLTLGGTTTVNAENGVATFTDVQITKAGTYTLYASTESLTGGPTSDSFTVTAGPAAGLKFTTQPGDHAAGTLDTIVVTVQDEFGNTVTDSSAAITLALGDTLNNLTLDGTTTINAENGVATFTDVKLTKAGTYTLSASTESLTVGTTSDSFDVTAGPAAQLAFTTQPANHAAGKLGTIVVTVQDEFGNTVTDSTAPITLTLGDTLDDLTLNGTTTVNAQDGAATFTNVKLTKAGTYTLSASTESLSDGATSDAFDVTAGAASKLAFVTQPTHQQAGALGTISVEVRDQYGNLCASGANVTLALNTGTGPLMGTKTVAAVDGVATFEGLAINAPGYKTLKATAGELTKAVSDSFDVGAKLVITPVAQKVAGETFTNFAVRVTDHAGKTLTTNSADVTLSLATSPEGATIDGTTTVTAVNGVATFSDVDLQTAGVYRISADAAGLVGATTYYFRVIPAAPAALTFTQDASNLTAGAAITAMKVQVVDAFGNLCVYGNRVVTLAKKTGPGAVTGWLKAATVNGVATFGAVRAVTAGDYVLTASLDTLTVDSAQFTVSPAAAKKVVFTQQPTAAGVNTNIAPAITASIQDAYGNVVTTSTATITLTQAQGPAGGIATASKAAVAGVATFNTVKATKTGSYRIRLSGTGLVAATSSLFTISNNG